MFTGIVEECGTVRSVRTIGGGKELTIVSPTVSTTLRIDNSICVNGVCLTVVRRTGKTFVVQAVEETLSKTNLGTLSAGSLVNLERSVRLSDRLSGHIVQGHVDCTGRVVGIRTLATSWLVTISFPKRFRKYLIPVGSVCVDGTSLTVARLGRDNFTVAIIPFTYEHTVFRKYRTGSTVNIEFDVLGKYLESLTKYSS